jgi:hypothetical protein
MNLSPRWVIPLLQSMCIALAAIIYVSMVVITARIGLPPVPLDTEGHMDQYPDSPSWSAGFPE